MYITWSDLSQEVCFRNVTKKKKSKCKQLVSCCFVTCLKCHVENPVDGKALACAALLNAA